MTRTDPLADVPRERVETVRERLNDGAPSVVTEWSDFDAETRERGVEALREHLCEQGSPTYLHGPRFSELADLKPATAGRFLREAAWQEFDDLNVERWSSSNKYRIEWRSSEDG